jgi:ABC-type bacteriocin/lantibiotic exporter with double-glycine peptidase domain
MLTEVKKWATDKNVFIASIVVLVFFSLLILVSELEYNPVIIGVLRELLTLSFLGLFFLLIFIAILSFIKTRFSFKSYAFYSLLIHLLTLGLMIGFA